VRVSSATEAPLTPALLEQGTSRVGGITGETGMGLSEAAPTASFDDVFKRVLDVANNADAAASKKVDDLARGLGDDIHGTMIAVKEADISIKLVATIRNKLLDAFTEIWKTSV
jgi:flagellar hook-basal body complex protein FliE